jgi:rod shape-determining protein MreD
MNGLNTIVIMLTAYLAVFLEAVFDGPRRWLGVQIDLLPVLAVYAGMTSGLGTAVLLAFAGGCWFDALSANPLGTTVLPLLVVCLLIRLIRELVVRDRLFAQAVLGSLASVLTPVLSISVLSLFLPFRNGVIKAHAEWGLAPPIELGNGPAGLGGAGPLLGWTSVWAAIVMAVSGAILCPLIFGLLDWIARTFSYPVISQTSFRPDRQIKRGRSW